jgi:integrase-like protein
MGLPESNGFNAILVIVCRLTKMRHFIPCKDTCTAEEMAKLYSRNIFKLYGMPKTVVSDRGSQFIAKFWKALCQITGIYLLMSRPYHPETDGQTERMNAILEQYLWIYVNYLQDDWENWLHLAEFAANNQASETTRMSPFFATYGQDPIWQFDFSENPQTPEERNAHEVARKMHEIKEHLQAEIGRAQMRQQDQADRRRMPAPNFQVGNLVWFNAQNVTTQ